MLDQKARELVSPLSRDTYLPLDPTLVYAGHYGRSSNGVGVSIEGQSGDGLAYIAANGYNLVISHSDKVSAAGKDNPDDKKPRPGWDLIRQAVDRREINLVVVRDVSRADRDMMGWIPFVKLCKARGCLIYVLDARRMFDSNILQDEADLMDSGNRAHQDLMKITQRSRNGKANSIAARRPGTGKSFGYIGTYDKDHRLSDLRPDAELRVSPTGEEWTAAGIVTEIYRRYDKGEPLMRISRDLNARGILTPGQLRRPDVPSVRNGQWLGTTIHQLLIKSVYKGTRTPVGGIPFDGDWPKLVQPDLWQRCQDKLVPNVKPRRRRGSQDAVSLFSGHLYCATCEYPVYHIRDEKARTVVTLRCGRANPSAGIKHVRGGASALVEAYLTEWLEAYCLSGDFRRHALHLSAAAPDKLTTHLDLTAQLTELQNELDQARVMAMDPNCRSFRMTHYADMESDHVPLMSTLRAQLVALRSGDGEAVALSEFPSGRERAHWDRMSHYTKRRIVALTMDIKIAGPGRQGRPVSEYVFVTPRLGA